MTAPPARDSAAAAAEPNRLLRWLEARVNVTELFSSLTIFGVFYSELDARQPLRAALAEAFRKPLPAYARWPRILGPLSMLVLVMQLVSGLLLALYYQATPATAHESVRMIVSEAPLGWFVHQMHSWGSKLLVGLLLLRVVRLALDGFYRAPRELIWMASFGLLLVALGADFTGLLLTWNHEAYWSTVRGIEVLTAIPLVGQIFTFVMGGDTIGGLTLTRFYILHLAILPLVMLALYATSFATVRRVGLSDVAHERAASGAGRYRAHLVNLVIALLFLFGGLVTLAVMVPFPFRAAPDPMQTPPAVAPPWYLLAPYAVLQVGPDALPQLLRGGLILLAVLVLLFLPFLVRRHTGRSRRRWMAGLAVLAALAIWLVLTLLGAAFEGRV